MNCNLKFIKHPKVMVSNTGFVVNLVIIDHSKASRKERVK